MKVAGVLEAVEADLREVGEVPLGLALGATARALAKEIDSFESSPTSKAACARALADVMGRLRAMAPEKQAGDGVDEVLEKRRKRRES